MSNPYPLDPPATAPGPLAGRGILVTRPARQAGGLAAKLSALGATPIVFPALVILPPEDRRDLDRAHARLAGYDFAFFVSANAVEYGAPAAHWPGSVIVFAPGPGTAEALAAIGIGEVRVPTESYDSEGLLALPELQSVAGRRAIVFRGAGGRDHLAETLRERGAKVDQVACYRRAAPASGAEGLLEALREGRVHALTITSSEALDNLLHVLGPEGRHRVATLPLFVPHARIAQRATERGLAARTTEGGDAGLIAGLLAWAEERIELTPEPQPDAEVVVAPSGRHVLKPTGAPLDAAAAVRDERASQARRRRPR
jgi:uroporphyrinogen-III synthase